MMSLSRRDLWKPALGAAAALALRIRPGAAQQPELQIGALYPLTGVAASFGTQQANGLKLAVQFINDAGGVKGHKVTLEFGDATNNATAVSGAERLVGSKVPLIFGTASSGLAMAASPVAERAGVVYVETGALNAALNHRGFKFFFHTRANNEIFARQALAVTSDVLASKLGKKPEQMTAVVLHEDGPFGTEVGQLMPELTKQPGSPKIVSVDAYNIGQTKNFGPLILRYQDLKPDVIYWAAYPSDAILFWRQAKQQGYTPPSVVAFSSGPGTPEFLNGVGKEDSNGVLVLDVPLGINPAGLAPEAAALLTKFQNAYASANSGQQLTGNGMVGFAGGWILLKHVLPLAEAFTPEAIQAALHRVDLPEGALPTGWGVKFDESGQNVRAFPIGLEWQDGALTPIWPAKFARSEPKYLPLPGSK